MKLLEKLYKHLTKFKQSIYNFLNKNFTISSSKASKITGVVFCFLTLIFVILFNDKFLSLDSAAKWILLSSALLCPFVVSFVIIYTIRIKNESFNKIWHFIFLFLMPFLAITMTECLNGVFIYDMTYLGFFANYMLTLLMYFLIFGLSGSFRVSYISVTTVLYGFALAHCYVMEFRGTPFIPMDFLSISTAMGVANTYNYSPNYKIILATFVYIFIIVISIKTKTPKYSLPVKITSRCLTSTVALVLGLVYFGTSFFTDMGIKPDFWNQTRGYKNYGFAWSFFANTRYLYMSEPDNYNAGEIGDFVNGGIDNSENYDPSKDNYTKPNIICIMNESLSDLSVLGEFETNKDYMPFMRSLKKNTVKGNLYVPVIGAGTSNSEFEFITGHTTAFLPAGSNAYMLYIDNPLASLVSTLEGQGYSSYAMHPYYRIGWNRENVYNNLGFNRFVSLENLIDVSIFQEYQNNGSDPDFLQELIDKYYPNTNMLLRQYVSDSYNYDVLIEDFENRDKSVPYFAFNVTMQNHGGYTTPASNFDEEIHLVNVNGDYPKTNRYLSLIKKSDDAFKKLINYFKNVEEPTVICMFGDHQPSIETDFIAEIMDVNSLSTLSIEQIQQRYCTPFFIWANYDIEEKEIDKLSVNYLSSYVLETAGVKLSEYNKYLLSLSKILPVIDNIGYIDKENNYFKWSDSSEYTSILDEYEKIQYNNIFDQENVNKDIFYINGYEFEPIETEE